ncbi:MAG: diguanylate cyclase [Bacteriovoracia bacterium]
MTAGSSGDDPSEKTEVLSGDLETLNKELAKAKEQDACLIVIRGTPQGHRFFLTKGKMIIGRDPAADVTLSDQSVSRKHVEITKDRGKTLLSDLGSANGTIVNGKRMGKGESVQLVKEDMVRLGNTILKYLPAGEIETLFYANIASAANTDPLTRVYNRRYFNEALEVEFKRTKALHSDLAVIYFDIDHFKKVNDTHGHDAGDFILKEFSAIIRTKFVRPKDVFARFGGEEFVLLLANTKAEIAADIAENIRATIEAHAFIYKGKRIPLTMSAGVAEVAATIESAQTFINHADKALYESKSSGRNRVTVSS